MSSFPKFDGWCERCRADGLEYAVMLYPIGPSHVARMCSNVECSDIANDDVQMDVLKTDIPRLQKFFPDPVSVLDESIFSDEECDCGCKEMLNSPPSANSTAPLDPKDLTARHNASVTISSTANMTAEQLRSTAVDIHEKAPSTSNVDSSLELCSEEHRATMCQDTGISARSESAQVTVEPFGEPTVSIGDSAPTASLCTEPSVCVNSAKHMYRTSQTCDSTCDGVGQVLVGQVREPTNNICNSSSLCADSVWMDPEEPSINICDDVPLRADSNVCMDMEELTGNNCGGVLLYKDSDVCKDTVDPRINVCDSVSLCADSHVCRDIEEHVYITPHNSTSTCHYTINATADKERVHGVAVCDSVRTHPFSANTSLCMNRHEHVCRPCHAVHIPNAVVKATVTVATSSPGSRVDDLSVISHDAGLSSEAETGKWNATCERRTFYTSLMPKKVAVKVVASSERPSRPFKHASASDNRCSDVKQEGHVDITSNICTLNRMGTVLKVKVVAASEGGPSFELSDNISTPMLLAPSDTNSWLELMPEELADEVNCAFSEDSHEMIEMPAVKSASEYGLKSTEEPIMLVSPSPHANTEKANVGPKNAISSPAASPLGFMECHLNHEHREGADVSSISEGALRDLGKANASVCAAVDSAGSMCATENDFVEWTDEESIVKPVSTNRVTDSAFSSMTVSDAINTQDKFSNEVCDMVSLNESSSTSLSTSSEKQPANSAAADNSTGEKGTLSMIDQPEDYERADEIPKLAIPLQQLQVNTVVATNHDPIVVGVTTDLPSQPDGSDIAQESCHEEEQRATVNVDWHNLTFPKDSITTVPIVPNSSEASLTENFTTGIEIEVSTTEPPEPLPKYADTENVITNHISSHLSCSMLGLHNRCIIESIIENFEMPNEANMSSTEPPEPSQKCGDAEYFITDPIPPLVSCSLFSSPNRSERSVLENLTTASEISSTEQPEPLQLCGDSESDLNNCVCPRVSCSPNSLQSGSEADLPEQPKVVKEVPSVELFRPSTKEKQDTEIPVHCLKSLSLQNTSEGEASSPGNLMELNEALTDQTRISKEGEHTEAVVASSKRPASPAVGALPCLPSNSEASSSEISVVIDGTMPVELPLSSKELWRSTENIGSHLNPDASPYVPCGLPNLEGKAEGSLAVCPGPMNAALSTELTGSPLKGSSTIQENLADITPASNEYTSLLESLPNEQADTEGVHMHGENHLSNTASNWQSSPCRSEVNSPERAVGANKTHSLGLLEPSEKGHEGTTRKVIDHCEPSPASSDVTEPSGLPSESRVSALGPVEDPLSASLHIAESMCNMKAYGHRNIMLNALRTDNLCTDTSITQELPLQSSGLNVLRYVMLKGNAGGEAGHLSPTSFASPQPPIGSFDEIKTPLPSETFNTTAKLATHAGDVSGNLQQCVSVALLQPSTSTLSYKPRGAKAREGVTVVSEVTKPGSKSDKISGTKIQGQAVVFSVSGIQKGVQNIVIKLPSNIVSEGNTETAAVNLKGTRRHTRNTRMKRQVPPACADGAGTSKLRKTKATEDKEKSSEVKKSLPLEQKTSRTGSALMDKLALINKALAVPLSKGGTTCVSGGTPKDSKINLRSRHRGTASANKAKQPPKSQQTLTRRGVKQALSRKRKGSVQTEQVVPDILQPVLSPTSSEFGSVSSKPSQMSSSGTSSDAASSNSTCKTGSSVWKSISSCKSAEEYVELIKNCLFPMEESGSGFPGYHPVLATRPPYNGDKKPSVIAPKRRRRNATTPLRQTTEAASADVNLELDRYVSELSGTKDTSQFNSVLSELFDCIA